jgi:hypothetical protein
MREENAAAPRKKELSWRRHGHDFPPETGKNRIQRSVFGRLGLGRPGDRHRAQQEGRKLALVHRFGPGGLLIVMTLAAILARTLFVLLT